VLVDLVLPDSRGIETFDQLFRVAPRISIIVLCAGRDEGVAKLAVQRGAPDYVLKSHLDGYWLPKALHSMVERAANAEVLFEEKKRAQVTLESIGDAVIRTDVWGRVASLNGVAERLTGWLCEEAAGRPIEEVFRIIDATTREAMANPLALAIRGDKTVALTRNCILLRRNAPNIRTSCREERTWTRAWTHMSVRSAYVRQRADESRRSVVQCSVTDQRRVKCISVAASLELFCSFSSLSTLCGGSESTGTMTVSCTGAMAWKDNDARQFAPMSAGLLGSTTLCR
jgi:PAS domain-containing protein